MKTSRNGMAFILAEEAIVLSAYQDSAKVWTIGAGHTAAAGPPTPKAGMTITLAEALDLFRRDLERFEAGVLKAVKAPLKQHEFDALVSFHYNTGAISTGSVDDKLNRGDRAGAMATLTAYNKAGGRTLQGLVDRRARERALFERGDYGSRAIAVYDRYPGTAKSVSPSSLPWPAEAPPAASVPSPVSSHPAKLTAALTALVAAIGGVIAVLQGWGQ